MDAALKQCANVGEAIQRIKQIPHYGNPIYLLLDASGDAARVEVYRSDHAVQTVKLQDAHPWLASTTH